MSFWSFVEDRRTAIKKMEEAKEELVKKIADVLRGLLGEKVTIGYSGREHTGVVKEVHQEEGKPVKAYVTFNPPAPQGDIFLLGVTGVRQED